MDIQIVKDETPTEEQADAIREQVKASLRDGYEKPVEDVKPAVVDDATKDPWAGVPAHIRTEIETLRSGMSGINELSFRLKKAEQRIGAMGTKLSESEAARAAAEAKLKSAPTPEQILESKKLDETWEEFKSDNPDIAGAVDAKMSKIGRAPTTEELLAELEPKILSKIPKAEQDQSLAAIVALSEDIIEIRHPNYKDEVKKPEFAKFISEHPEHSDGCKSMRAIDAIKVLDAYSASKVASKTAAQIKEDQAARIKSASVSHITTTSPKEKNIDDMSPEEIREMVKKKFRSKHKE